MFRSDTSRVPMCMVVGVRGLKVTLVSSTVSKMNCFPSDSEGNLNLSRIPQSVAREAVRGSVLEATGRGYCILCRHLNKITQLLIGRKRALLSTQQPHIIAFVLGKGIGDSVYLNSNTPAFSL